MPTSNAPVLTSGTPVSRVETLSGGSLLDVGDGHRVWWCEGGDPEGEAVLVIHGGPGGRSRVESVEGFAGLPVRWICMDQRGCGRSTPRGEVRANTLAHLLDDIELLRSHLGITRWSVAAGSWGAFVALAWAARCPDRLSGLFLRSPFLGSREELAHYLAPWPLWLGEAGRVWLDGAPGLEQVYQWADAAVSNPGTAFSPVVQGEPADVVSTHLTRSGVLAGLFDDAQSAPGGVRAAGADDGTRHTARDEALRRWSVEAEACWRVHAHYARTGWTCGHDAWAWAEQVLRRVDGPVMLVHGVEDAVCPVDTTRRLAALGRAAEVGRALQAPPPGPRLQVVEVPAGGHRMGQEPMRSALREAFRAWAWRLTDQATRRSGGLAVGPR